MTMPFVYDKPEADKLANAKANGQACFDNIREMVEALNKAAEIASRSTVQVGLEDAERAIHEDALSVEVRSGWHQPGVDNPNERLQATEYRILLCTGGPAVQIVGDLNEHGEPETAVMQVQDWFLPWTDFHPARPADDTQSTGDTLLAYARCFYFGE